MCVKSVPEVGDEIYLIDSYGEIRLVPVVAISVWVISSYPGLAHRHSVTPEEIPPQDAGIEEEYRIQETARLAAAVAEALGAQEAFLGDDL